MQPSYSWHAPQFISNFLEALSELTWLNLDMQDVLKLRQLKTGDLRLDVCILATCCLACSMRWLFLDTLVEEQQVTTGFWHWNPNTEWAVAKWNPLHFGFLLWVFKTLARPTWATAARSFVVAARTVLNGSCQMHDAYGGGSACWSSCWLLSCHSSLSFPPYQTWNWNGRFLGLPSVCTVQ